MQSCDCEDFERSDSLAVCNGVLDSLFGFCTGWIAIHGDGGALGERPLPQGARKGCEAMIADLIVVEPKLLHMAHQTKHLSQESAPAKSQGMGTRQWGASAPSSGPGPRSPPP